MHQVICLIVLVLAVAFIVVAMWLLGLGVIVPALVGGAIFGVAWELCAAFFYEGWDHLLSFSRVRWAWPLLWHPRVHKWARYRDGER